MGLFESFELAIKNILLNKMRTFLTVLGIVIGVLAVIVIAGLGNGMKLYMEDSLSGFGAGNLDVSVFNQSESSTRNVTVDKMYKIMEDNPQFLKNISPKMYFNGDVKIGSLKSRRSSILGVSEDYMMMKNYQLQQGRNLQYLDMTNKANVCVIGSYIAQHYFGNDALGQTLRIQGTTFTVVGVLEQKDTTASVEGGIDDCVWLPYTTVSQTLAMSTVSDYMVTVVSEEQVAESKRVLETALEEITQDKYSCYVSSMAEMAAEMNKMIKMVMLILTTIAGISLLVGGIGIMNIMLVSVTERTREIGIRKALGAKEKFIMRQFIIEAATTSALGGVIGLLLGYGLCAVASIVISMVAATSITVVPSTAAALIAVGISTAIGVLFGYLPAKKASRLNPIDALRF